MPIDKYPGLADIELALDISVNQRLDDPMQSRGGRRC